MKFTHLHVHSHYSLLDGLPKIDQLLDHIKDIGMDSVALTDHGVLYGAVEFYKKAQKRGVKAIIGSEVYVALDGMDQKRPGIDDKRHHLVLLVKNEKGYKNLVKLITKAHLEGFYYKPRIDEDLLAKHSEGLIGLSACLQGKIPRLLMANKTEEAEKIALKYQKIFEPDSFYLEIQDHPGIPDQEKVNKGIIAISKKLNIPLVATNDCHYLKSEDSDAQDILMLINTGADINNPDRLTLKSDDFSIKSAEKMAKTFKYVPEAIKNTQKIADLCNFHFKLGEAELPHFEVPSKKSPDEYLKELTYEGLKKKKFRLEKNNKEITKRIEYELSVIKKTGFASYFLIVQDFVNWAKNNRIVVGPGRGSAAGSLVSFLLNITDVDPLKYNLLFERFLNPERAAGLPDIDLDFTDRRRDEVINYVRKKYGQEKVAQIITFGTMAARAAIRDVGRALGYTYAYCDQIAKMIPLLSTLDQTLLNVAEFKQIYDTDEQAKKLINFAKKLEGVIRHASTHACGVVISKDALDELVPLQHPTQNEETIVTQYEMHSIEDLGLLKMDFLGLKNLTIIEDTLARIYKVQGKSINIENIPLDEKKAYKILQQGNSTGVFQLESDGMKRYLKQLKPTEFEDIVVMVALYRPGPMQFIPEYIARAQKKKEVRYLHPKLKPILERTHGICIFQEQLMQIARDLAGFSMGEADFLRKAVGKKIKKLLMEQKEKMINGMIDNGIRKETAQELWNWVLPFARYGFNKSHSVSYAKISYQTAYLKATYPVEFMAALLTSEKNDTDRISFLISECKRMKIEIMAPDINESFRNFSVIPKENKIRFGLLAIKNVGENVVEAIIGERKQGGQFSSIKDFLTRVNCKVLNKKSMESLIKSGVFDKFEKRNKLLTNLGKLLECSKEIQKTKNNGQKGLFDGMKTETNLRLTDSEPIEESEKLKWEKELLGLYISSHPLKKYKEILKQKTLPITEIINGTFKQTQQTYTPSFNGNSFLKRLKTKIKVGGIISNIKKIITKTGKPMLFLKLEDLTDKIEVIAFPNILEKNPVAFQEDKIVFVTGKINKRDGTPKIIAEEIEEIIES